MTHETDNYTLLKEDFMITFSNLCVTSVVNTAIKAS